MSFFTAAAAYFGVDPSLFWTAIGAIAQIVQALVVIASAILVIVQVNQIRREAIQNKIAGLKAALEALDSDTFKTVSANAESGAEIHGINWRDLLDRVDLVALLVAEKYTHQDLLLKMRGHELGAIGDYLSKNAPAFIREELTSKYSAAYKLMEAARQWRRNQLPKSA